VGKNERTTCLTNWIRNRAAAHFFFLAGVFFPLGDFAAGLALVFGLALPFDAEAGFLAAGFDRVAVFGLALAAGFAAAFARVELTGSDLAAGFGMAAGADFGTAASDLRAEAAAGAACFGRGAEPGVPPGVLPAT
jgi:hypothetical protein